MAFDSSQNSFKRFRDILTQRVQPIVVWVGSGLSVPAGLPSWQVLKDKLISSAERDSIHFGDPDKTRIESLLSAAKHSLNLWESFRLIKLAMLDTSFISSIRQFLSTDNVSKPPPMYEMLWSLGIRGCISLNIDRFASLAFSRMGDNSRFIEFHGMEARYHADVLRSGSRFVVNMHGELHNDSSWVFTPEDFEKLQSTPGYKEFIQASFLTCTVLFIGISADDIAAGGHLARLKASGCRLNEHYWITARNDGETRQWCEDAGISAIYYSPENNHRELTEALAALKNYVPPEVQLNPILPSTRRERNVNLPPSEEVERMNSEEIRQILNKEAIRILDSNAPDRFDKYKAFWEEYSEAIHRAWSVSHKPTRNKFFDYEILEPLAGGAFGQVYKGRDATGKLVAIKVLHSNVRDEDEMLQGFRRGVRAMEILSKRNIKGMVPYIAQWEIPAATVMDFIGGTNLQVAVESGYLDTWSDIMQVSLQLVQILQKAHNVPEHVLHRDLRPPNVMLQYSDDTNPKWTVIVLDFDLSWHREALEVSIGPKNSASGYMAPEQIDLTRRNQSRNALVDSFGLGMTLFFTASGVAPLFGQQKHSDWATILKDRITRRSCSIWHSLPTRFARLIEWSTQDEQSKRWDFSRIRGEIERLNECLNSSNIIRSCELITEELAFRCPEMRDYYNWNGNTYTAKISIKSGFDVSLIAEDAKERVRVEIDWNSTGDTNFESFRKFMPSAVDKCCNALKSGGWVIDQADRQISNGSARVQGTVKLSSLGTHKSLELASNSVSSAIKSLRLS